MKRVSGPMRRAILAGPCVACIALVYAAARYLRVAFVMNKHVEAGGWDHRSVEIVQADCESLAVAAHG